jgi:hypothetical protein
VHAGPPTEGALIKGDSSGPLARYGSEPSFSRPIVHLAATGLMVGRAVARDRPTIDPGSHSPGFGACEVGGEGRGHGSLAGPPLKPALPRPVVGHCASVVPRGCLAGSGRSTSHSSV